MSVLLGPRPESESEIKSSTLETPRRPSIATESLDTFEVLPQRKNFGDAEAVDHAFAQWSEAATNMVKQAAEFVALHQDSPAAHARHAQAAWSAGLRREAVRASSAALDLVVSRDEADVPAAYAALAILLAAGASHRVEKYHRQLPRTSALDVLMASAYIDSGEPGKAEELVSDSACASGARLYGYSLLARSEYAAAVAALRRALRCNPTDPDAAYLLSFAYAGLGADRKALRYARQAAQIAPGRKDIGIALLHRLVGQGDFDGAEVQYRRVVAWGAVEFPELLVVEAGIHASKGKVRQALAALRRASDLEGEGSRLSAELESNIAALRARLGEIGPAEELATFRKAQLSVPDSLPIASALFRRLTSTADADEAARVVNDLRKAGHSGDALIPFEARAAYLAVNFDACLSLSLAWHAKEPENPWPASVSAMILGQLYEDWPVAAEVITSTWRINQDAWLANDVAYVLALADRAPDALDVLGGARSVDYVVAATRGLALTANGHFAEGLRAYRSAAELADKAEIDGPARALMTVHQAMALRRLGLDADAVPELRAGVLPSVALPEGWRGNPGFCLLALAAERHGWEWPVMVN